MFWILSLVSSSLLSSLAGCASAIYKPAQSPDTNHSRSQETEQHQLKLTIGGNHPRLDALETAIHYPAKKIHQWFSKRKPTTEPEPSDEERRAQCLLQSEEFLAINGISDMYIDVRDYSPTTQWRRMRANPNIHSFWKYTAGTLRHVEYCMIPGRVFHRDSYNVFTNTLSINSLQAEQTLYTAATAKYLRSKDHPGAYSAACYLPIVPLFRDYHVANDVLSYARFRNDWESERLLYRQVYSSFGSDAVSQATSLFPQFAYFPFYVKPALSLGGGLVGRGAGYFVVKHREQEIAETAERLENQSQSSTSE